MKFIPFSELSASRQKAIQATNGWRVRAEQHMNDVQMEHGTQSPEYAACFHALSVRLRLPQ